MADKTEYVITIKLDGDSINSSDGYPQAPNADGTPTTVQNGLSSIKGAAIGVAAYGYAKKAVNALWDYNLSTINIRTGQTQQQEREQFSKNMISRAFSIGESFVAGTILGGGNPIAGLVGMGINLVATTANVALESARHDLNQSLDDIGRAQANIRASTGEQRMGRRNI